MGMRDDGRDVQGHPLSHTLEEILHHQAHYLPDQGPISTFIHHNTLHAFEHLDFHAALEEAFRIHKAKGYLPHSDYLQRYRSGEITDADLSEALSIRPGTTLDLPGIPGAQLARGFLMAEAPEIAPLSRAWWVKKGPQASRKQVALYEVIAKLPWVIEGTRDDDFATMPVIDLVKLVVGGMASQEIRRCLAQMAGPFLDRGAAIHSLPGRREGFFVFALSLLAHTPQSEPWLVQAAEQARFCLEHREPPEAFVSRILEWQQPDRDRHADLIRNTLLSHPGWAGMFWRMERYPSERPDEDLPVRLIDYLAIQLLLEKEICLERSRERYGVEPIRDPGILRKHLTRRLTDPARIRPLPQASWSLLFALDHAGITPAMVESLGQEDRLALVQAAQKWAGNGLLSIWQEAFEASYRRRILDGMASRARCPQKVEHPTLQLITCIDDREESFRRALEELDPSVETFGAAGFFGIPVQYTPLGHSRALDLCPVNVKAVHRVRETPDSGQSGVRHLRNQQISRMMKRMEMASRVGVSGSLFGGLLGLLVYPAMVVGLLFPRLGEKVGSMPARLARGGIRTKLEFEEDPTGLGSFPVTDQVARLNGLLENAGLTRNFAPLVILMGHGSTSVNNPHKSAYDCGACGGNEGAASARIFANLINRPEVRKGLASRGIVIPETTVFVGCLHDTSSDAITIHDGDIASASLPLVEKAKDLLQKVARRNARERCRRFHSAPRHLDNREGLIHVQSRAADLGQPRPELGHATNAITILGRRELSRGLFLDRRAFLISYDPSTDPSGAILERMIAAVGPVVAGISLEYYFSRVDNQVFGCGTKLPHNPVGLVGVQEGAAGDLRTGLPRQMIEIHPPLRLTIILETTREILEGILRRQAEVSRLVNNGWVRVVTVSPDRTKAWLYLPGIGHRELPFAGSPSADPLPTVSDSPSWYLGHMEDLPPALIEPRLPGTHRQGNHLKEAHS